MEKIIIAFVVGGVICVIGQLMMDLGRLTPAHTMAALVSIGAILGGFGLYDKFVEFAGAGASIPISSFGNSLFQGAMMEFERNGIIGVITGIFEVTSAGISSAIIFAFIASLIFRPKG